MRQAELTTKHGMHLPDGEGRASLTDGEENERPPILPPDLAASASPGADKATAATVATTANFFAMSVVKASHGVVFLLLSSPSPPAAAAMRRGTDVVAGRCCCCCSGGRVSPVAAAAAAVVVLPVKQAEGTGTKPDAGTHAASRQSDAQADLMMVVAVFRESLA